MQEDIVWADELSSVHCLQHPIPHVEIPLEFTWGSWIVAGCRSDKISVNKRPGILRRVEIYGCLCWKNVGGRNPINDGMKYEKAVEKP